MSKQIKLVGRTADGAVPRTGKEVAEFFAEGVIVTDITPNQVTLQRPNATYVLKKHNSLNIYTGVCNGIKVHFTKKKVVATLIYWPKE